jgi:hypothetical protein
MATFYMVYLEYGGAPSYKHDTLLSAETEAKRLAQIHGKKTYVLATVKSFEVNQFNIEDCRPKKNPGELPF